MGSLAVCSALRHPVSKGWGIFSAFFPYLPGMPAMYGFLRHPTGKGWGVFSAFFPYLPAALPLHGFLRYPLVKGWGIYGNFLPYLWQTPGTFATLFPPSKVHPSPIKQACRTPQRRFLYGTVSRVPRVQKEAVFLYRMYPQAARVQQKAPFLYRTENRLKVIEF